MSFNIEELANQIASLDRATQEALLEKVAELNFQLGLEALSQKYRQRLMTEGNLNQRTDEILAELARIREDIAVHDYQS